MHSIKLKPGWTSHDGTPVTAQSYVNAWNYTALSTNALHRPADRRGAGARSG